MKSKLLRLGLNEGLDGEEDSHRAALSEVKDRVRLHIIIKFKTKDLAELRVDHTVLEAPKEYH
jgi:hypothetical protein